MKINERTVVSILFWFAVWFGISLLVIGEVTWASATMLAGVALLFAIAIAFLWQQEPGRRA
jgi:hypothetical protein